LAAVLLWLNRAVAHTILKVQNGARLGIQVRLGVMETDIRTGVARHPLRLVGTGGFRQLRDRFPPEGMETETHVVDTLRDRRWSQKVLVDRAVISANPALPFPRKMRTEARHVLFGIFRFRDTA